MSIFKNGDPLTALPVQNEELSFKEKTLLDMLYPNTAVQNIPADTKKAWYHFKDIIVATILFFILGLPITDRLLSKFVKTENFYYSLAAKSAIFALSFFVINNFYLSRAK
jgi:hypothetical protein